jgi:hypothetical protein
MVPTFVPKCLLGGVFTFWLLSKSYDRKEIFEAEKFKRL